MHRFMVEWYTTNEHEVRLPFVNFYNVFIPMAWQSNQECCGAITWKAKSVYYFTLGDLHTAQVHTFFFQFKESNNNNNKNLLWQSRNGAEVSDTSRKRNERAFGIGVRDWCEKT